MEQEFDSKPVYNEQYLKTIRKCYELKFCTNFYNDKLSKEGPECICLSVTLVDSVYRNVKSYHPLVILKECKYIVKEKRSLNILLATYKFSMMEKILINKCIVTNIQRKIIILRNKFSIMVILCG